MKHMRTHKYNVPLCLPKTQLFSSLNFLGAPRLTYVGFSQGTAQAFAAFSINAKLAQKVELFVALAPSTRVKGSCHTAHYTTHNTYIPTYTYPTCHVADFNSLLVELRNPICAALACSKPQLLFLLFGKKMMLGSSLFWRKVLTYDLYAKLIDFMMNFLFGWQCDNIASNEKPLLYSHLYSYASVKCMVHWFQITASRRFQMFDDNIKVAPWGNNRWKAYALPAYHPSQIKCPMALFCGDRDTVPDTEWLLKQVPAPTIVHREPKYEHLDFLWAHDGEFSSLSFAVVAFSLLATFVGFFTSLTYSFFALFTAPERVYSKVVELIEKKDVLAGLNGTGLSAVSC